MGSSVHTTDDSFHLQSNQKHAEELEVIYKRILRLCRKTNISFTTALYKIVRKHGYKGFSITKEEPNHAQEKSR